MIELYPEYFNDVFGPVMQRGSSSHTAGPCRLGLMANSLLGEAVADIRIELDKEGSLASTFGQMNEDGGMLGGAMGFSPDSIVLLHARAFAKDHGITYEFAFTDMKESSHNNSAKFLLTGVSGKTVTLVGNSIGGGMVETVSVNGYPFRCKGDTYVLFFCDPQQHVHRQLELQAQIDGILESGIIQDPGTRNVYWFKCTQIPSRDALQTLAPDMELSIMAPVLPVITTSERKPQLFDSMSKWRELAREQRKSLYDVAVDYEVVASGWTREQVIQKMHEIAVVMHREVHAVYEEDTPVLENLYSKNHFREWARYSATPGRLVDDMMSRALRYAFAVKATVPGVSIVPGPMGSGGGYIYSALSAVKEVKGYSQEDLERGLMIAAAVGAIAYTRTSPTGETIGCAGECGCCGAMAAAAITEMCGGTPEQVESAASLFMQISLGWPCDPVPGGQPCRSRSTTAVIMSIVFADFAMSGRDAAIPFHEVLDVADTMGRALPPEYLCAGVGGGCCGSPTGERIKNEFKKWQKAHSA